jgi:hypothetical protein
MVGNDRYYKYDRSIANFFCTLIIAGQFFINDRQILQKRMTKFVWDKI